MSSHVRCGPQPKIIGCREANNRVTSVFERSDALSYRRVPESRGDDCSYFRLGHRERPFFSGNDSSNDLMKWRSKHPRLETLPKLGSVASEIMKTPSPRKAFPKRSGFPLRLPEPSYDTAHQCPYAAAYSQYQRRKQCGVRKGPLRGRWWLV